MSGDSPSLRDALEELYGASPGDFTKTRAALVKRLHDAGDEEGAAALRGKRKPTQSAWILNQLARRHPDEVTELVDVGRGLARAQRSAIRGNTTTSLRETIDRQRKVVAQLTRVARKVMADLGVRSAGHFDEVAAALRTAVVDPVVGAQLEEGRLDKAPEAAAGFGGPMPSTAEVRSKRPSAKAKENAQEKARKRRERKKLAAATAELRRAETAARKDQTRADEAREEARRAAERADALSKVASRSSARAAEARRALARLS
jgi:hypothetical protein